MYPYFKKHNIKRTVTVLGATGQTGKYIVQKLLEHSIYVRVLSRSLLKAREMFGNRVEIIQGDLGQRSKGFRQRCYTSVRSPLSR